MLKQIFLILILNQLFLTFNCSEIYPVVVIPGLTNACQSQEYTKAVEDIKYFLDNSVYVRCVESGAYLDSIFIDLTTQAENTCKQIQEDPNLQGNISVIGGSQGGVIARYIVENCEFNGSVKRLITLGSPHMGIVSFPLCFSGIKCIPINNWANKHAFEKKYQDVVGPAGMWYNPSHYNEYLEGNLYLPKINNQNVSPDSQMFKDQKQKMEDLEILFLGKFAADQIVNPPSSPWFYQFNTFKTEIVPIQDQDIYTQNLIGLKTLDEKNALFFLELPGKHMVVSTYEINKFIIPVLKGQTPENQYTYFKPTSDEESEIQNQKYDYDYMGYDSDKKIFDLIQQVNEFI